jgi:hypothetical protein
MRVRLRSALAAGVVAIGVASPSVAQPQSAEAQAIHAELDRLRGEFDALRREYGERFGMLEARLAALERTPSPAGQTAPAPSDGTATGPQGTLPIYGTASLLSKIFNPDVAVVGNVVGAAGRNAVETLPALDLRETEMSFQAVVDPYARADFFFGVGPEGIAVEEGFITFPTLPGGVLMKAGKLRSAFGKVNAMHGHVLPWADRPLAARNLLGGDEGLADAGISVARLVPNPWLFLEATGEVHRGRSALFAGRDRRDLAYVGHLRGYRDLSESSNVEVGASFARGPNDAGADARTSVLGFDGTFRYRPLRRAIYRRVLARTELLWSRRSEAGGANPFGAYLSAEYQFARRWFAGVRYDHAERATDPNATDTGQSWLLTFWPSEFSQVRTQYRRTRYSEGETANELLLQLLFSIGAHGAHPF